MLVWVMFCEVFWRVRKSRTPFIATECLEHGNLQALLDLNSCLGIRDKGDNISDPRWPPYDT